MAAWISNHKKLFYTTLIILLGFIFYLIARRIISPDEYANSDFFTLWLSGRLAGQGQNLYDSQVWVPSTVLYQSTWIPNLIYVYPLPMALFFVPLGLLPVYPAFVAWDVLTQFMILAALLVLLRTETRPVESRFLFPLLAGIVLFRPTIVTLTNGQLSGLLLLLIAGIISLWSRGKWEQGAALLALFALKPNLGAPIIGLITLYLLRQKKYRALAAEAVGGLALLLVGLVMNPNWVVDFWNAGNTKLSQTFGYSPTLWGVAAQVCGHDQSCTMGIGLSVCALFALVFLLVVLKKTLDPAEVCGLAISLMLLCTPYTWPYDQLLLVAPITMLTVRYVKESGRYLPAAALFLGIDLLALLLLLVSGQFQREFWNAGVPLLVFILLIGYVLRKKPAAVKP